MQLTTDELLASFTTFFNSVATNCKTKTTKKKQKNVSKKTSWYSVKCKVSKTRYNRALKIYRRQPFNRNLQQILINTRKQYIGICKESEAKFRRNLTSKLLNIEEGNPKEFWNLINRMKK